jgi:6-phosphogluconolactonase
MVSDSGAFVYVTNRDSDTLSVFAVDQDSGALAEINGSPFAARDGPRAIEFSGKFAFVANRFEDTVSVFEVDTATGALSEIAGSPFAAGDDPRSEVVHPSGKYLYVMNAISSDITAYSIDAGTGALAQIQGSPFPVGATLLSAVPPTIEMDAMGKVIYVTDSASNGVSAFRVDEATGALQPIQTTSTPGIASSIALR